MLKYNCSLKNNAKRLRRNMTDAERKLWQHLRKDQINGVRFYRQKPIGNYIVDFYCPKLKLVVELDGDQHFWKRGKEKDKTRDKYLKSLNLKIIRVSNIEVFKNSEGIIRGIWNIAERNSPR